MAIPLRVIQQFYVGASGCKEWVGYRLEVWTAQGWEPVPVVMEEVPAPPSIFDIAEEKE
jgi:hypothetical protein